MTAPRESKSERVLASVERLQEIAEGIQGSSRPELDREIALLRAIVTEGEREGRKR